MTEPARVERPIRRVALIVNPAARAAPRAQAAALRAFAAAGVDCTSRITTAPGEGARLARECTGQVDAVFTLGGDGTAMEVVDALAYSDVPVGVLPGGTGNLVARTLGIPLRADRAVQALLGGDRARVDLGRLTSGRRFAFAAGVGVDAHMIAATPPSLKRRLGVLAYVVTAAGGVLRRDPFRVRCSVDGEQVEREAVAVMVANFGTVLNELVTLGPGIRQDDGQLDLCVFGPRTTLDAMRITWRLHRRDFRDDPCALWRRGRRIRIETDPPRLAQADGELIGETPVEVTVEPLAATLLVPRHLPVT